MAFNFSENSTLYATKIVGIVFLMYYVGFMNIIVGVYSAILSTSLLAICFIARQFMLGKGFHITFKMDEPMALTEHEKKQDELETPSMSSDEEGHSVLQDNEEEPTELKTPSTSGDERQYLSYQGNVRHRLTDNSPMVSE